MMSEYENPTITFYPHESEFDVTPEEQKPALSTNFNRSKRLLHISLMMIIWFIRFSTVVPTFT